MTLTHGVLKVHREASLLLLNLASAGVLAPIAVRATGALGSGITFG